MTLEQSFPWDPRYDCRAYQLFSLDEALMADMALCNLSEAFSYGDGCAVIAGGKVSSAWGRVANCLRCVVGAR